MQMNRFIAWSFLCAMFCATQSTPAAGAQPLRPMTPDDLLSLERLDDVQFSPDGKTFAYVRQRSLLSNGAYPYQQGEGDRSDVWIAQTDGDTPIKLTTGSGNASFWLPRWSPDGERLAMLSTKDGNVHLWVWERTSGQLRKLSDLAVAIDWRPPVFVWIDGRRIAASLLPPGVRPMTLSLIQYAGQQAMDAWQKAWVRGESSASVLESGITPLPFERPIETLTVLDAAGDEQPRILGSSPTLRDMHLSPDRRHLAFLTHLRMWQPSGNDPLPYEGGFECLALAVTSLHGEAVPLGVLSPPCVAPRSLRWSPDGHQFAFIAQPPSRREAAVVIRKALNGAATSVTLPNIEPLEVAWADRNHLLVHGQPKTSETAFARPRRTDWWLVSPEGPARNLTQSLAAPPDSLFVQTNTGLLTAVAGSDIWQRRIDADTWIKVEVPRGMKVTGVVRPGHRDSHVEATSLLLSAQERNASIHVRFDMQSRTFTTLSAAPSEHATVAAYAPQQDAIVFIADERDGTFMTLVHSNQRRVLATTNEFLRTVAEAELKAIEYRSQDGRPLKAWLLLPVGYKAGTRYPVVASLYAGDIMGEKPPPRTQLNDTLWFNLQLLAARGYAVLVPSMPLSPDPRTGGAGSDPYFELPNGVLPALDKAIDLGIADPERQALIGHSYGGYSVYGLVTQTNRFKAGIALAAPADLSSHYGSFYPWGRYTTYDHQWLSGPYTAENGQTRMGSPPWRDSARYIRNSPLTYIERVQTPLLIVQGDMDGVLIAEGEKVFTALYRQGKRARFVRYWGEGHMLDSPANIKDFWTRVYDWLDECLSRAE